MALSADGGTLVVGARGGRGGGATLDAVWESSGQYSRDALLSLTHAQMNEWNGLTPDNDWAIVFKLEQSSIYGGYVFRFHATDDTYPHYDHLYLTKQSSGIYYMQWSFRNAAGDGQHRISSSTPAIYDGDVQFLLSYNKLDYSYSGGSGGDSDPQLSTSSNGPGLSFYYRTSTDGGTSYSAWTQVTSASQETLDENTPISWPSDMAVTFGAWDSSGTNGIQASSGQSAGTISDIYLYSRTLTTSQVDAPRRRRRLLGGRRPGGRLRVTKAPAPQHWANPDWYTTDTKILAYFDFTQTNVWDNTRAVDLGPNGNDITYNAYGNAQGTVEYVQTSALNYLAVNNVGRWDMRLELDTTGPVGHTMAMGCWIKLRHGSNGLDTIITTASGTMGYGTTETNGHFFGRGGISSWSIANIYDFGIGVESVGKDTWSHSVIGSQKTIDYIKAQPDYENTWWCWQARLTAEGRVETSLDGSPFALAQNSHGDEDLATVDLINSNNKPALPVLHIGCDGYGDNRATNSYGAMFWYRDGEYTDEMAFEFYNVFKDKFKSPTTPRRTTLPIVDSPPAPPPPTGKVHLYDWDEAKRQLDRAAAGQLKARRGGRPLRLLAAMSDDGKTALGGRAGAERRRGLARVFTLGVGTLSRIHAPLSRRCSCRRRRPWARQFFDDTTRTALHIHGCERPRLADHLPARQVVDDRPAIHTRLWQRSGLQARHGVWQQWYWDSYIEIYQGTVGLRWHHKDNSGGSGHDRVDLYPDFSIVEGTTYDLAITYDATLFNAGPGTHPDVPPDGGSQEGYALQFHVRDVTNDGEWTLPNVHTSTGDLWDNDPPIESTIYERLLLECGNVRLALYDGVLPWRTSAPTPRRPRRSSAAAARRRRRAAALALAAAARRPRRPRRAPRPRRRRRRAQTAAAAAAHPVARRAALAAAAAAAAPAVAPTTEALQAAGIDFGCRPRGSAPAAGNRRTEARLRLRW